MIDINFNLLDKATQIAITSDDDQFKIGCVVVDKNSKILSIAANSNTKTHPYQARLAHKHNQPYKIYLHAEIRALLKCRGSPHTLYVVRVSRSGNTTISKPCPICMEAIKIAGVKNIVYTDKNGNVNVFKVP